MMIRLGMGMTRMIAIIMECSISFQNGDPSLGKPSGAHVRRSAARAGRPQGFLAGVLHFAGWCLHAAALHDGGQRLLFRLSDFARQWQSARELDTQR